ncbi:MAG: response regulator [Ignavibacteriales bacterium]|nr:MAG: response regulator [Ignavibacteriaceae bacterium]MBW7874249.1 response regulator [Ignavibacteria bacterium]MCZ2143250.1 response regulator [Ignavibacteriales bacterium]OQY71459.1 MAG: hypothetical protein B6D45_10050 [Ignavibacteriales bacterium UTCHB3]MBV6444130.1 Transcriptional regulatory protein AfsQ1 [Ignavibacteriaceae bacterium]
MIKILLIDDDSSLAKLFHYSLTKNGFECRTAENGAIGYNVASEWLPDLIISDVMMPEMDGFELRRKLLADSQLSSIPFVFLTAKSADDDLQEGKELGVADYIVKTEGPKVLVDKVKTILNVKN